MKRITYLLVAITLAAFAGVNAQGALGSGSGAVAAPGD